METSLGFNFGAVMLRGHQRKSINSSPTQSGDESLSLASHEASVVFPPPALPLIVTRLISKAPLSKLYEDN
jgi:hypothetical protein